MNLKSSWNSLSNQKKSLLYWAAIILAINLGLAVPKIIQFFQTGQCRNYMAMNSPVQNCSFAEFARYGHGFMSFANLFALVPAVLIMIFASNIVSIIFAKKEQ